MNSFHKMCGWPRPQEEMGLSLSRTNMNWFAIHFDIPQIRWGPMKIGPSVLLSSAPAVSLLLIPLWPETQILNKCLTKFELAGAESSPVLLRKIYCDACSSSIPERAWTAHVQTTKHHNNEFFYKKNKLSVVLPGKFELDDKKSMYTLTINEKQTAVASCLTCQSYFGYIISFCIICTTVRYILFKY